MVGLWIAVGVVALGLFWGILLQLPKTRGWAFEKTTAMVLSLLPKSDYVVMNDLFFRDGRSTCQIDHLVVSPYGIFVIEAKNYLGVIRGNGSDKMLTRRVLGMRYRTRNPIDQNDWHIRFLVQHFPAIREHSDALVPMVVFNFSSSVKIKNAKCPVCKIQGLLKTIKSYTKFTLGRGLVYQIEMELETQNRQQI